MNQKQRTAMQRSLVHEALGKLKAAAELFGTEDEVDLAEHIRVQSMRDYEKWDEKLREFESWVWDESPIA